MERRDLLRLAPGVAALWGLSACGGGGSADQTPPAPPTPPATEPGQTPGPSQAEWDGLASEFKGQLVRPGHADYDRLRQPANARYDAVRPLAVLRCLDAADVSAALRFARRLKLPMAARSGGHSYIGNSCSSGLQIDVGAMNSVTLRGDVAEVGAGATLGDVYRGLLAQGRCIPAGSCLSVGIAGLTLGGGFGVLDRGQGLSCDVLKGLRMVTADGLERQCDASHEPDLFWASRGGGGGNFGIVTSMSFQTHAVGPLVQFSADFAGSDLAAILAAWSAWANTAPDAIWSQMVLSTQGRVRVWGIGQGVPSEVLPHWHGLLGRISAVPTSPPTTQQRSYQEVLLEDCGNLDAAQCHLYAQHPEGRLRRVSMAASSDFFDRMPDAGAATAMAQVLGQAMAERRSSGQGGAVVLNLMGGRIASLPPEATAFVHRTALFSAQYLVETLPGAATSVLDEADRWVQSMRERLQPWSSGRAYQNYLSPVLPNALSAMYGAYLERLQSIKRQVDPDGLFRQPMGIV